MTSIAFYLHTNTTTVERIVIEAPTIAGCYTEFVARHGLRSVAYTESLEKIKPLVTMCG